MIFQSFSKFDEPRSGEWYFENFEILPDGIIAKYHVQVMLLFVYNRRREIFGNAQETFVSLRFEKQTQPSFHVQTFSHVLVVLYFCLLLGRRTFVFPLRTFPGILPSERRAKRFCFDLGKKRSYLLTEYYAHLNHGEADIGNIL